MRPARPSTAERLPPDVEDLVTAHLPLAHFAVNAVAARISLPAHVSREDLVSCAHVALIDVARRFDASAGATFTTYALPRLQGAVLDELRSADWASRSVRAAARRTAAATDALTLRLGRPPSKQEVARELGIAAADLYSLEVDVHRAVVVSIDAETDTSGPLEVADTGDSPERAVLRGEQIRYLQEAIRGLPDRLDEVIERNFFGNESLTEIAADLGVTLSRVSQMRARALTLLHAAMSELWEGRPAPAHGGVRARNQQRAYLDHLAGGAGPATTSRPVPVPRVPGRGQWQLPARRDAAQPA